MSINREVVHSERSNESVGCASAAFFSCTMEEVNAVRATGLTSYRHRSPNFPELEIGDSREKVGVGSGHMDQYMQEHASLERVPRGASLWKIASQELCNRGEDSKDPSCVWKEVKRLAALNGIDQSSYQIKENQSLRLYDRQSTDTVNSSQLIDRAEGLSLHKAKTFADAGAIAAPTHSERPRAMDVIAQNYSRQLPDLSIDAKPASAAAEKEKAAAMPKPQDTVSNQAKQAAEDIGALVASGKQADVQKYLAAARELAHGKHPGSTVGDRAFINELKSYLEENPNTAGRFSLEERASENAYVLKIRNGERMDARFPDELGGVVIAKIPDPFKPAKPKR